MAKFGIAPTPIIHVTSNLIYFYLFLRLSSPAQVGDLHRCLHIHMHMPPHSTETWDFVMDCWIMQTFQSWLPDKKIRYHKNYWQSDLFTGAHAYGLNLMSISKRSKWKLSWLWYIVQTPYCKFGFSEIKMIKTCFTFSVLNISMSFHRWNIFYLFFCMMS